MGLDEISQLGVSSKLSHLGMLLLMTPHLNPWGGLEFIRWWGVWLVRGSSIFRFRANRIPLYGIFDDPITWGASLSSRKVVVDDGEVLKWNHWFCVHYCHGSCTALYTLLPSVQAQDLETAKVVRFSALPANSPPSQHIARWDSTMPSCKYNTYESSEQQFAHASPI
jgi:hypothetical protein